jgi:hypothetical protein
MIIINIIILIVIITITVMYSEDNDKNYLDYISDIEEIEYDCIWCKDCNGDCIGYCYELDDDLFHENKSVAKINYLKLVMNICDNIEDFYEIIIRVIPIKTDYSQDMFKELFNTPNYTSLLKVIKLFIKHINNNIQIICYDINKYNKILHHFTNTNQIIADQNKYIIDANNLISIVTIIYPKCISDIFIYECNKYKYKCKNIIYDNTYHNTQNLDIILKSLHIRYKQYEYILYWLHTYNNI